MKKPYLRSAATFLAGGLALALAGCGGDLRYIEPAIYQFENQKLIQSDFLDVWNRLETNIPAGFFTRTGTDRDGRTISVSFISDKPTHMVDCGSTTRYYSSQKGHNVYKYNPADSSVYTVRDLSHSERELNVTRTTRLLGEATIYLAEQGAATSVAVNAKYTLEVGVVYFDSANREISSENFTFTFTSENDHSESGFICTANGSVELKLLSYAE